MYADTEIVASSCAVTRFITRLLPRVTLMLQPPTIPSPPSPPSHLTHTHTHIHTHTHTHTHTQALTKAVYGMLPHNNLRKKRMRRLHLYSDEVSLPRTSFSTILYLLFCYTRLGVFFSVTSYSTLLYSAMASFLASHTTNFACSEGWGCVLYCSTGGRRGWE